MIILLAMIDISNLTAEYQNIIDVIPVLPESFFFKSFYQAPLFRVNRNASFLL